MPMHRGVLRQIVRYKDANFVAFDNFNRWAGRLAVITPEARLHSGRDFALDGLGDKVKFLPIAIHPKRQGPSVERDDRSIVRSAGRMLGRLGRRARHANRFRKHAACTRPLMSRRLPRRAPTLENCVSI